MVSQVSRRYIENAKDIYRDKLKRRRIEIVTLINEKYPRRNDDNEIKEIMDELRKLLPSKYKLTWQGTHWSCDAQRFYINIQACLRTSEIEVFNEKSRETKISELDEIYNTTLGKINDWEASTWVLLAQGKEIPEFNADIEFEI